MRYRPDTTPSERDLAPAGRLDPNYILGGDARILWTGSVVPDPSIIERLDDSDTRGGTCTCVIRDATYGAGDSMQFDNEEQSKAFPNEVTLVCRDTDGTRPARCSAFVLYGRPRRGLLRGPARGPGAVAKGFVLEPLPDGTSGVDARLALFRFDNSASYNEVAYGLDSITVRPSLSLEGLGLAAFASGSRGSDITMMRDPKRSVTIVFAASDQNPFASTLHTRRGTSRVVCGSDGFRTTRGDQAGMDSSPGTINNGEPLRILKMRLARGDITIDEYEQLRRVVE